MAPEQLLFADHARAERLKGVNVLADAVQVTPMAQRSQRDNRQKLRRVTIRIG